MNKIVHDIVLDVHKETIAVRIAPQNSTEARESANEDTPRERKPLT